MSDKPPPPPPSLPPEIEISENFCLFHKGQIQGAKYVCPRCRTHYCRNCALQARKEGKLCVKCKQVIDL